MIWGLLTALGFGTADFLARGASMRLGAYRALLYTQLISGFGLAFILALGPAPPHLTFQAVLLAAALGTLNVIGVLLLYRALAIGNLAIVSPVGSAFAAVTLALSLLSGDPITPTNLAELAVMVVGVLLASSARGETPAAQLGRGVPEALGTALALGVLFWGLQYVVTDLGPLLPVLLGRLMALLLLPLLARPLRQSIAWPPRAAWGVLVAIGVLDTAANVCYNLGLGGDSPGVVAVLGSLFSPITVLLALIFLRERLALRQWIGVGLIFLAIIAIGITSNFG